MTEWIASPYDLPVRVLLSVCAAGLIGGCGASGAASGEKAQTAADRAREAEVASLKREKAEQAARMREIEGRLALAQAELEELRGRETAPPFERDTVRIGADDGGDDDARAAEADEDAEWEEREPSSSRDRPVLRLYGNKPRPTAEPVPEVPDVPEGLPNRLPVARLPDGDPLGGVSAPVEAPPVRAEGAGGGPSADPGVRAYRVALAQVREREFEEAERSFRAFLARHASHSHAAHARYWHAEVLYALRRYPDALREFGRVVDRGAPADRVPEALFKMGLCHKRMGRPARARALFERVRREFPGTVAARLAAQEDAS
ncbi:MAG: tetratricopeptide repeat protein [Myxococcota bacterium]